MDDREKYEAHDAEKALLGAILTDASEVMPLIHRMNVNKAWFTLPAIRIIYEVCCDLVFKGKAIDLVSMHDELVRRGLSDQIAPMFMSNCIDSCTTTKYAYYWLQILSDKFQRRALAKFRSRVREVELTEEDIATAVSTVKYEASKLRFDNGVRKSSDELIDQSAANFTRATQLGYSGFPSRWLPVQNILGGYYIGKTCIIAGRPKEGKSMYMGNEALYLAKSGHPVGIISLEMAESELRERFVGDELNLDLFDFRLGKASADEIERFREKGKEQSKLPITITDSPMRIEQICSWIRDRRDEIKWFALDYLQLVRGTEKRTRYEQVTQWCNDIVSTVKECEVSLLMVCQLSRGMFQRKGKAAKRPELQDLRDSGAIEQDAFQVVFVYRSPDEDYSMVSLRPKTCIEVAANRAGPTGVLDFVFMKDRQKLMPWDTADNEKSNVPSTVYYPGQQTMNFGENASQDDAQQEIAPF